MTDKKPFQLYDKPKFFIGDVRGGGKNPIQIFDGQQWLTYPSFAADLLRTAKETGWGTDNGLPPVGKRMRTDVDGRPFLRLLIGRERGKNAATGAVVPAMQFHLTWQIKAKGWESATAYFKTDQPDTGWEPCNFDTAKKYMIAHPVRLVRQKTKAGK
jgi:hypothetical protein